MLSNMIYPMAAMVLLTAVVLTRLFLGRVGAVKGSAVPATYYKTFQGDNTEPRNVAQASRHYINLFEAPVLFYAACLAAMVTGMTGQVMVVLAWLFVAARTAHAVVHLGSNRIPLRIAAYAGCWLLLLSMWGMLVYGVAVRSQTL